MRERIKWDRTCLHCALRLTPRQTGTVVTQGDNFCHRGGTSGGNSTADLEVRDEALSSLEGTGMCRAETLRTCHRGAPVRVKGEHSAPGRPPRRRQQSREPTAASVWQDPGGEESRREVGSRLGTGRTWGHQAPKDSLAVTGRVWQDIFQQGRGMVRLQGGKCPLATG